jgi:hypothetical protein
MRADWHDDIMFAMDHRQLVGFPFDQKDGRAGR